MNKIRYKARIENNFISTNKNFTFHSCPIITNEIIENIVKKLTHLKFLTLGTSKKCIQYDKKHSKDLKIDNLRK